MGFAAYSSRTERAARAYLAKKAAEKKAIEAKNTPIVVPEPEPQQEPEQVEEANRFDILAREAVRQFDETGTVSNELKEERIPVLAIIKAVCEGTKFTPQDIRGHGRPRDLVATRDKAICITALARKLSTPQIGKEFGGRDHSSVLHCLKKNGIVRPHTYVEKHLTEADIAKIHDMHAQGVGIKTIAETMGIPTSHLYRVLSGGGKNRPKSRVVELFEAGKDTLQIAQIMGLPEHEVANRIWASQNLRNQNQKRKQSA